MIVTKVLLCIANRWLSDYPINWHVVDVLRLGLVHVKIEADWTLNVGVTTTSCLMVKH